MSEPTRAHRGSPSFLGAGSPPREAVSCPLLAERSRPPSLHPGRSRGSGSRNDPALLPSHRWWQRLGTRAPKVQALHGRIQRAVGMAWATEIPLLLQYLEGEVRVGRGRLGGRNGDRKIHLPSVMEGNGSQFPSTYCAAFPCPRSQH